MRYTFFGKSHNRSFICFSSGKVDVDVDVLVIHSQSKHMFRVTFNRLSAHQKAASRALTSLGMDPLVLWKNECHQRRLCDEDGYRLPGVHWTMAVSINVHPTKPPNLRTVGIERISPAGIDFCLKRGTSTSNTLLREQKSLAVLHTYGHYKTGEKIEQWRGEGSCVAIPVQELIHCIPDFTLVSIVGSHRLAQEQQESKETDGDGRPTLPNKSHVTEVMQTTRRDLENGIITPEEIDACVQAIRFQPDRLECMNGGPNTVFWDRYEWIRDADEVPGILNWKDPRHLVPH